MTDNVYVNTYQLYLWEEQVTASSSQCVSSESNYPDFVPIRTVHTCIIMFFDFPKQIYKTQKSRSCLQRTICLTLPQILHWEHLYQAETVKQNQTKSVHRYEEKKITQRQSNKTKVLQRAVFVRTSSTYHGVWTQEGGGQGRRHSLSFTGCPFVSL